MTLTMDVTAVAVLFAVQLTLLTFGDVAAMLCFVTVHLLLNAFVTLFVVDVLAFGDLAVLQALIFTPLLVPKTLIHLADTLMLSIAMALIIDARAVVVLFTVQLTIFRPGDMTTMLCFIMAQLLVNALIALFIMNGLALGDLAILKALIYTILLVLKALIHLVDTGMARIAGIIGLRKDGRRKHCARQEADDKESFDSAFHKYGSFS
jgi:hypothetical protein